jgi:myo-inositol-1(or 4)-monophosphatase
LPVNELAAVEEELALIVEAAREAGHIAMGYFRRDPEVWFKNGQSPVSQGDLAVDTFLRRTLLEKRPAYGWLSEETADNQERLSAPRTFVVDPIDGTRAFLERRDVWCVSIAVVENGRPLAGVLDCPAREEVYVAMPGRGATLNGTRIFVSEGGTKNPRVAGPKPLVTSLPERWRPRQPHPYIPSLAYRIAMLAKGDLDGTFVKANWHDWDLAAADLILTEAGGAVRDRFGRRPGYAGPDPRHGTLVAGSGALLEELSQAIAGLDH